LRDLEFLIFIMSIRQDNKEELSLLQLVNFVEMYHQNLSGQEE